MFLLAIHLNNLLVLLVVLLITCAFLFFGRRSEKIWNRIFFLGMRIQYILYSDDSLKKERIIEDKSSFATLLFYDRRKTLLKIKME